MAEAISDTDSFKWTESGIFKYFEFDSNVVDAKGTDNVSGKCKLCPKNKAAAISG